LHFKTIAQWERYHDHGGLSQQDIEGTPSELGYQEISHDGQARAAGFLSPWRQTAKKRLVIITGNLLKVSPKTRFLTAWLCQPRESDMNSSWGNFKQGNF